jgi:predicted ATPase
LRVQSRPERFEQSRFPFKLPAFSDGIDLEFRSTVTFVAGENGSGKSTLLEAIAECCGFHSEGGNRDHHREAFADLLTRDCLNSPDRFFKHLLQPVQEAEDES